VNFYFSKTLPSGLVATVYPDRHEDGPPDVIRPAGRLTGDCRWVLADGGHKVLARGVCSDARAALVCLRWAVTVCLERSGQEMGAAYEEALAGLVS
jgi:hypothetical protein